MGTKGVKKLVRIQIACWLALVAAGAIAIGVMANAHGSTFVSSALPQLGPYVPNDMGGDNQATFSTTAVVTMSPVAPMCRFGYAQASHPPVTYDAAGRANLRAGWYVDFGTHIPITDVTNMEYAQIVRVHQVKSVPPPAYTTTYAIPYTYQVNYTSPSVQMPYIASVAQLAPGSLWLIGNEIERRDWRNSNGTVAQQDEILPEVYADAYHQIYTTIKAADPTARVAIGGVIEITDLRLKYLDRIWNSYLSKYGTPMPVDVWNMHPYPLREEVGGFGADIPAGLTETAGTIFLWAQNDDLDLFKSQILRFRQWMAAKGQSDKPLVISEFGVLLPNGWGPDEYGNLFTEVRVKNYMYGAFDYLLTAKDATLGYKSDDNRLVQQWNWFSLDGDPKYFNGDLFSNTALTINQLGLDWKDYVTDPKRSFGPPLNLKMLRADYNVLPGAGSTYTAMVWLHLSNSGYLNWTTPVTVQISTLGGTPLTQTIIAGQPGCGRTSTVALQLQNLSPGLVTLRAQIDPMHLTPDVDFQDNTITFTMIVSPASIIYLPLINR